MFKKIIIPLLVIIMLGVMAFKNSNTPIEDSINRVDEVDAYEPIVVLELFTSQGCSSCPSADVLLDKMKKTYKEEVFALSYHVDYWNYIGWKDPFSKPHYTKKQRLYNVKFQKRSNYTPQIVVNGKEHFVGSSSSKMYTKVNAYNKIKVANKITVSNVKTTNGKVNFDYTVLGNIESKKIKAVLVLDERTTHVNRGENRNRTLKNSNIVVAEKFVTLTQKDGVAAIAIPTIVKSNDDIQLIMLIENDNNDITGATKVAVER